MAGRLNTRTGLVAWVAIAVAVVSLLVVAGVDDGGLETDAERVQRLAGSYACPTCQGQSVADSNAAVAANIRQLLSQRVADGATDREIRDELVAAYNAEILLNPPAEGIATLVWVLPVVLVVVGAAGVAAAVTRNKHGVRDPSTEDRDLLARALAERTTGNGTAESGEEPNR
ncbi:MAG: cytochrome c-type biogenesis protein CcmH [Actinomycetota bacterium]